MTDTDGTLDHRAELMRKWSADKALMAQAGLLSHTESQESAFLGAKTTQELLRKRQESKKSRDATMTKPAVTHTTNKKKSNRKKSKTSKVLELIQNLTGDTHTKRKTNGYLNSSETVEQLDAKVGEQLGKYKSDTDHLMAEFSEIIKVIPDFPILRQLKSQLTDGFVTIQKLVKEKINFEQAYIEIAKGLFKYVHSSTFLNKINHAYSYPPIFNWLSGKNVLQKGFLLHELLTMTFLFLQKNSNAEGITKNMDGKEKVQDAIHILLKHKHYTDKTYTTLKKMKEGLDAKAKTQRKANPRVDHTHLKFIQENIEEDLHHETTFHMANPYE
jgi:hypothetical protein